MPSSKAAASEEASRTLRYVEPLSDARTPLADFFSILLEGLLRKEGERPFRSFCLCGQDAIVIFFYLFRLKRWTSLSNTQPVHLRWVYSESSPLLSRVE